MVPYLVETNAMKPNAGLIFDEENALPPNAKKRDDKK